MSKFIISPHFRLQEWVAEEKGYFAAEGLDYEFRAALGEGDVAKTHTTANRIGAYQSFEKGRSCDVSGACHWTVNVAASNGHGKLYADAYSISTSFPARRWRTSMIAESARAMSWISAAVKPFRESTVESDSPRPNRSGIAMRFVDSTASVADSSIDLTGGRSPTLRTPTA